jgi:hypothetical protein
MAKKKVVRISRPIVEAYLERIGQRVFKDFSSVITDADSSGYKNCEL